MAARALRAGVEIPPSIIDALKAYIRLLARWNSKINLTSLPLEPPADESLDRLLVEPLAALPYVPTGAAVWLDLGSGGGSPAIPLKIAAPRLDLTMIESRARKAAFLAEAVRTLALSGVRVENQRVEDIAADMNYLERADLVTVRAIKPDRTMTDATGRLLKPGGELLVFGYVPAAELDPDTFESLGSVELVPSSSRLSRFRRL